MKEETMSETSSLDAQWYVQIQPDWGVAEDSCWIDVYNRAVKLPTIKAQELIGQDDKCLTAKVHSCPSSQYQLPLSTSFHATGAPAVVQVLDKGTSWVKIGPTDAKKPSEASMQLRPTVFQVPHATVDVPMGSTDSKASGARAMRLLQLNAVDVSFDERFVVLGGSDGVSMLWDRQNRTQMLPLQGHVADVTSVRFYPSSKVVLTGSLDFTLRIWSIDGRCAAVMKGHRGGVEDIAILGRGRNVLSCGTDGFIQLWNCGTQDVVAKWANDDQSPVHCLAVLDDTARRLTKGTSPPCDSGKEAETDGKVLFAGLDNGETLGVDVRTRAGVLNIDGLAGSIISCAATTATASSPMLFTGSEDGLLTAWDLRHTSVPLHALSRSSSAIHSIVVSTLPANDSVSTWTAHGDGGCCSWSNFQGIPHICTELTGPQYDAVRGVALAGQTSRLFTACRDGRLREYIPHIVP
ncbi:unnamed protein product [Hyaloperonospora brassicae]|uniref:Proteasomal ATPase-associated factor 1 n=1 Tax=Hyaloperonospora brassicae TaxID=162125 RepID=A0AAV0V1V0_HYABA|nr:unnamed protein product [Hyaloperonospora brassicae]